MALTSAELELVSAACHEALRDAGREDVSRLLHTVLAELAELRGAHGGWTCPSHWNVVSGDTEEEWLEARQHYLTASDVAAVVGLNRYRSREQAVRAKALGTRIKSNAAMKAGQALEAGIIALEAELSGRKFVRVRSHTGSSVLVAHPTIPRLAASLDGVELDDTGRAIAAVEAKCTRGWLSRWQGWPSTKCQLQVQMACAGLSLGHIAVNAGTDQKRELDIPPRQDFIERLPSIVEAFWRDVDALREEDGV